MQPQTEATPGVEHRLQHVLQLLTSFHQHPAQLEGLSPEAHPCPSPAVRYGGAPSDEGSRLGWHGAGTRKDIGFCTASFLLCLFRHGKGPNDCQHAAWFHAAVPASVAAKEEPSCQAYSALARPRCTVRCAGLANDERCRLGWCCIPKGWHSQRRTPWHTTHFLTTD